MTSREVVSHMTRVFANVTRGESDQTYLKACDELADYFETAAEARRQELELEPGELPTRVDLSDP